MHFFRDCIYPTAFLPPPPLPHPHDSSRLFLMPPSDSRPAMPFSRDTPPSLNLQNNAQSSSVHTATEAPTHSRPVTPSSAHSWSSELDHDIIPPYHPGAPRTLVLCFDGTGDQFDRDVRVPFSAVGWRRHSRDPPSLTGHPELERRQVLQPAQARRQTRADGILPGARSPRSRSRSTG